MTADEAMDLGRAAVACPGWRWVPGMRRLDGHRYLGDGEWALPTPAGPQTALHAPGQVPDLTDPCTAGGLLALVREAWGDSGAYVRARRLPMRTAWVVYVEQQNGSRTEQAPALDAAGNVMDGPTEPHALVNALRAAPVATR